MVYYDKPTVIYSDIISIKESPLYYPKDFSNIIGKRKSDIFFTSKIDF